jgi:hypothetical protein
MKQGGQEEQQSPAAENRAISNWNGLYQDCQTIHRVLSSTSAQSQLRHISVTAPLKNGKGELRVFLLASLALGLLQKQAGIEETGIILIYIPGQLSVDYLSIICRLSVDFSSIICRLSVDFSSIICRLSVD